MCTHLVHTKPPESKSHICTHIYTHTTLLNPAYENTYTDRHRYTFTVCCSPQQLVLPETALSTLLRRDSESVAKSVRLSNIDLLESLSSHL